MTPRHSTHSRHQTPQSYVAVCLTVMLIWGWASPSRTIAEELPRTGQDPLTLPATPPKKPSLAMGSIELASGFLGPLSSLTLGSLAIGAAAAGTVGILAQTLAAKHETENWPSKHKTSPSTFDTVEYQADWGLDAMKAANLYAQGATGKGVTLSMFDTGIHTTHQEFTGLTITGAEAVGLSGTTGNGTIDDPSSTGHGTHVAGTMLGRKDGTGMHGVAYETDALYVVEGGAPQGCGGCAQTGLFWSDSEINTGITAAIAAGSIATNNSWGGSVPMHGCDSNRCYTSEAAYVALAPAEVLGWKLAAGHGHIMVWATGNDYMKVPTIRMGAPYYIPELKDTWVTVIAIDSNLQEVDFTNQCGDTWEYCVAAPGRVIYSSMNTGNDQYENKNGTSMAAPHVTGAIAALASRFPGLTNKEVLQRLFATTTYAGLTTRSGTLATNLPEAERRQIFGRGLVQLVEAGKALGGLSILTGATIKGQASPINRTTLSLGTAFGDGLEKNLRGVKMAVFDNYQRATFWVDADAFVKPVRSTWSFMEGLATLAPQLTHRTMPIKNFGTLQMTSFANPTLTAGGAVGGLTNVQSLAFTTHVNSLPIHVRYDKTTALGALGFTPFNTYVSLLPQETMIVPYAKFAQSGLSLSLSSGEPSSSSQFTWTTAYGNARGTQTPSLLTVAAYQAAPTPSLKVVTHTGLLVEPTTFLGSQPAGAFRLAPNSPTYFVGSAIRYQLFDDYYLEGAHSWGLSRPQTAPGSLITSLSPIVSNAFSLGFTGPVNRMGNDRWGIRLSQPLRVIQGTGDLTLATQRNRAGTLFTQTRRLGLMPQGRQLDIETFYTRDTPEWGQLRISGLARQNAGHRTTVPLEWRLGVHFQRTF